MKHYDKLNFHRNFNKIFFLFFFVFSLYSFYLMGVSPFEYVRFFSFAIAGILCPGLLISRYIKCDNSAEFYSYSIAIGMGINFLIYAFCGFIRHLELYQPLSIVLCFISAILLAFSNKKNGFKKGSFSLPPTVITCIIIMLFIVTFALGFKNISPQIIGENSSYQDIVWALGNINTLTKSFPPRIPHLNIGVLRYHYFAMLLRAMLSLATSISVEKIFLVLGQFIIVPFLIISAYALLKKILKTQRRSSIALVIFLLSGCASSIFYIFGVTEYFLNHLFSGFWALPNGSDVAVSFFCLWVLSFIKIYNGEFITEKVHKLLKIFLQFISCAALCFLITLSKGPFGAVCVAAAIGVPFCLVLQKKPFLKTTFYSFASVVGFFTATSFFFSTMGESNSLFLSATVKNSLFWQNLVSPLTDFVTGSPDFLSISLPSIPFLDGQVSLDISILAAPLHAILTIFPCCLFMIFATAKMVKSFKTIPFESFLLLGTAYSGLICGYIFAYSGSSQTYFILAAHLPITILGLQWLFDNYKAFKKSSKNLIVIAFAFSFITGIFEYSKFISAGFKGFTAASTHTDATGFNRNRSCTREEYEAAIWIKENTPINSVIATNRYFLSPPPEDLYPPDWWDARYFYLSAYSDRQMFLEGWEYSARDSHTKLRVRQIYEANLLFYLEDDNNKPQLMQAVDVDYIYVSKFVAPTLELSDKGLEKVFSNSDADIYAISS